MTRDEMLRLTRGIALAVVTPLTKDGGVDDDGIGRLVNFLLEKGMNRGNGFLIPLSTTGNFLSLSMEERKQVAKSYAKSIAGRIPLAVGCNHIRLADTLELAKFAQDLGAIAILVSPPFYWRPTDAQVIEHYEQVCRSVEIGVLIYNNHWASQNDISVEALQEISKNPKIIGLKESTYSIEKLTRVTRLFSKEINILNGPGEAFEPLYWQLGCTGFTSTLGNIVPEYSVKLHSLLVANRFEDARSLAHQLTPLTRFLDGLVGGQYISALMHVLNRLGICEPSVRPPLLPLQRHETETLEKHMKELVLK
jgi:4-hydroxy-tetrahydrodipicolinate synthase